MSGWVWPGVSPLLVMASPGVRGRRDEAHAQSRTEPRTKLIFALPSGTDWSGSLPAVLPCAYGDPGTGRWDRQRGDRAHTGAPPQGWMLGGLNDNLDVEDYNTCQTPVHLGISYHIVALYYPGSL